jgi:hypothetical protein
VPAKKAAVRKRSVERRRRSAAAPTPSTPDDNYDDRTAAMIVSLIEQGVSLAPIARATGIPVDRLAELPVARSTPVATNEELSQTSTRLAMRALEEGLRILDEGDTASRIRLITSVAGHPLRRMQTNQGKAVEEMKAMLRTILTGGSEMPPDEQDIDDTEADGPDD